LIEENLYSLPIEKQEMFDNKNNQNIKLFRLLIKNNVYIDHNLEPDYYTQISINSSLCS